MIEFSYDIKISKWIYHNKNRFLISAIIAGAEPYVSFEMICQKMKYG